MDNYNKLEYVKNIIAEERAGCQDISWHSHLLTKQFEFEKILPSLKGDNILELGSAGHLLTTRIFAACGLNIHLVDTNDRASNSNFPKGVKFFKSDWFHFHPPKGEIYSDIFFIHGLEHVKEGLELLKKIKSWMDKDTILHIIVPNALSFHRMIGVEMGMLETPYSLNENDLRNGHVIMYDMQMLLEILEKAGLNIISKEGIQFKPLTDSQLYTLGDSYINATSQLSNLFTKYCSEIYIRAGV